MANCPYCHEPHSILYKCNAMVANVVANKVANTSSRHGKYADPEKRRAYMRAFMKKKRAGSKILEKT